MGNVRNLRASKANPVHEGVKAMVLDQAMKLGWSLRYPIECATLLRLASLVDSAGDSAAVQASRQLSRLLEDIQRRDALEAKADEPMAEVEPSEREAFLVHLADFLPGGPGRAAGPAGPGP